MATVKRLNSSYTIDTADVYLTGNLHVVGAYDTTNVTDSTILDRNLYLNSGETGAGVGGASPSTAGIIIERGSLANVALRWNETADYWEITKDGSTYYEIASTATTGITAIVQDLNPQLGGNLQTNGFHVQFDAAVIVPTATASKTKLYAGAVGGGTTGLYVVNTTVASEELVTKTRAFGFSLIL